jgi:hypothetical protein
VSDRGRRFGEGSTQRLSAWLATASPAQIRLVLAACDAAMAGTLEHLFATWPDPARPAYLWVELDVDLILVIRQYREFPDRVDLAYVGDLDGHGYGYLP